MLPCGVESYTCTANSECRAYVNFFNKSRHVLNLNLIHNHNSDLEQKINGQKVSNSLKYKAIEDFYNSTKSITKDTDVVHIKTNMFDSHYSLVPKLPHNRREIHTALGSMNLKTNENDQFLLLNDQKKEIIIFCTESNLRFLSNSDTLYVDGTLQYGADILYLLFTVYVLKNNFRIPLMFSLLPNKYQSSYEEVFRTIQNYCVFFNNEFNIKTVYVDFEKNLHNAVHQIWPHTIVKICSVRLRQAWKRMIDQHGLTNEYVQYTSIGSYLTQLFGLPYLDAQSVGDCFATELAEIQPSDDRVVRFLDCLVENYIDDSSYFPPEIWADQSSSIDHGADTCKSFHYQFSAKLYASHPNIFKFIDVLKTVQTETAISIQRCDAIEANKNTIHLKINFIDSQILDLQCGIISRFQFLSTIANEYKLKPM